MVWIKMYPIGTSVKQVIEAPIDTKNEVTITLGNFQGTLVLAPSTKYVYFRFDSLLTQPDPDSYVNKDLQRRLRDCPNDSYIVEESRNAHGCAPSDRPCKFETYLHTLLKLRNLLHKNPNDGQVDQYLEAGTKFPTAVEAYKHTYHHDLCWEVSQELDEEDEDDDEDGMDVEKVKEYGTLLAVATSTTETVIAMPYHFLTGDENDKPTGAVHELNLGRRSHFRSWTWFGSDEAPNRILFDLFSKFHCVGVYDSMAVSQPLLKV